MCVQARRHKEEAERKVEELQLQHSHLLSSDKTTTVSVTFATQHLPYISVTPVELFTICITVYTVNAR